MDKKYTLALIGNPNCGKTTLFNALTGAKQRVGNWPGVTVEKKSGLYKLDNLANGTKDYFEVIDLPGTYSLETVSDEVSLDEMVTRNYVQAGEANLIINIVDAANLERNLFLTLQLIEMGVPLLVVLNMVDIATSKGAEIDSAALSLQLGCPVVPVVASKAEGINALKLATQKAAAEPTLSALQVTYVKALEVVVAEFTGVLQTLQTHHVDGAKNKLAARSLALRLLEGDDFVRQIVGVELSEKAAQYVAALDEDIDILVADARYSLANNIVTAVSQKSGEVRRDLTDKIDRVVLNRLLGIPIFLFMMYLMFMFTINIGGAFIDFFDQAAAALFVDGFGELLGKLGSPEWLTLLLAKGLGGGVQTVATFIPIIGFLYLFLSVLEDSGYMARAAFVMDRFMRWVGLPGKSFVPLIVGFGCNVPAIMGARTLEKHRDRLMTIAMAPFMSCGARLPVYVLFGAAFFPENAQNIVFALYLIGILVAVITGLFLRSTLLQGEATPFIMELPPYHLPTLKGILFHTWSRLKSFTHRAGRIIIPMVLVLNVLNSVGTDGSFGNEDSDKSMLAEVGRQITPAFSPIGIREDNWPAAVGIFTGILAKEALVGTLNSTYQAMAASEAKEAGGEPEEEKPFVLREKLAEALATIPEKLTEAVGNWANPLGLSIGDVSNQEEFAEANEVAVSTFGTMVSRFDGAVGAFAYLLFVLLYFPCAAAIAAVYQESGIRWALFVGAWTTGMAYGLATLWYQVGSFSTHPKSALIWISIVIGLFIATFTAMRIYAHRKDNPSLLITQQKVAP